MASNALSRGLLVAAVLNGCARLVAGVRARSTGLMADSNFVTEWEQPDACSPRACIEAVLTGRFPIALQPGDGPNVVYRIRSVDGPHEQTVAGETSDLGETTKYLPAEMMASACFFDDLVCKMYEEMDGGDDGDDLPKDRALFPLPRVDAKYLELMLEFGGLKIHGGSEPEFSRIPSPVDSDDFAQVTGVFAEDARFVDDLQMREGVDLLTLLKQVHFVSFKQLEHLLAAKVATMIRNKEPAEVCRALGVEEEVCTQQTE